MANRDTAVSGVSDGFYVSDFTLTPALEDLVPAVEMGLEDTRVDPADGLAVDIGQIGEVPFGVGVIEARLYVFDVLLVDFPTPNILFLADGSFEGEGVVDSFFGVRENFDGHVLSLMAKRGFDKWPLS